MSSETRGRDGSRSPVENLARRPRPTSSDAGAAPSLLPLPAPGDTHQEPERSRRRSDSWLPMKREIGDIDSTFARGGEPREAGDLGTVLCETEVRVQVLLPPPYSTVLPWRFLRIVLGRVLSTTVTYVLPRFLEVSRLSREIFALSLYLRRLSWPRVVAKVEVRV